MADHSIRKVSQSGIGYSVVDLNEVRHVYAVASPLGEGDFEKQAEEVLRTVDGVISEQGTRGSIVRQAVFLADIAHAGRCRQMMRDFYGADLPAITYIPQPPCGGRLLAIEALGVGKGQGEVEIRRVSEELVVARHSGIDWVHSTNILPHGGEDAQVYDAALGELQAMCRRLRGIGLHFGQVVRTWYYLGGITEADGAYTGYQEFDRARSDFFRHEHFRSYCSPSKADGLVYPASTEIGATGRGAVMGAIAITTDRDDIRTTPLENPRQATAGDCPADGSIVAKFCPAMVLSCGKGAMIFISGTASITDPRTRQPDDAVRQTEETLDNIAALIGEENLARSGLPGLGSTLASLALARVSIKRPADFPAVRAACRRRLGTAPTTYTIADLRYKELLVEIEGVAFSRLAAAGNAGA
jgi:enamine deaminase RidA (YjgF/YER057c/UK114 family)